MAGTRDDECRGLPSTDQLSDLPEWPPGWNAAGNHIPARLPWAVDGVRRSDNTKPCFSVDSAADRVRLEAAVVCSHVAPLIPHPLYAVDLAQVS